MNYLSEFIAKTGYGTLRNRYLANFVSLVDSMPNSALHRLISGLVAADLWFNDSVSGKSGTGKLDPTLASTTDLSLEMNTFRWLTRYVLVGIHIEDEVCYRKHDMRKPGVKVGDSVAIAPAKPILSWSLKDNPRILGRTKGLYDAVLTAKFPASSILWSPKCSKAMVGMEDYFPPGLWTSKDSDVSLNLRLKALRALQTLVSALYFFSAEQEVIVMHGSLPVKATVKVLLGPGFKSGKAPRPEDKKSLWETCYKQELNSCKTLYKPLFDSNSKGAETLESFVIKHVGITDFATSMVNRFKKSPTFSYLYSSDKEALSDAKLVIKQLRV